MGTMIIDPEGNTIYNSDDEKKKKEEQDNGGDVPVGHVVPGLEVHVPDSDLIRQQQEDEQAIISSIIGHPLS